MRCLDENLVTDLVEGRLSPAARAEVEHHIDGCAECRDLLAVLMRGTSKTLIQPAPDLEEAPPDEPMLGLGEMIDHFRIVRRLGAGGMGDVYVAQDTKLGRNVALKVIKPGRLSSEAILRFEREARAMARVSHPSIVTVFEIGQRLGAPYAAMELVEGESLGARLDRERLSAQETIRIGTAVAEAIAEAHKRGVVHRDLKPDNILLSTDGRVRVVDFGLAAVGAIEDPDSFAATLVDVDDPLAGVGTGACGTPMFMAPEQWEGTETTPATDVWALGVILHLLLSGEYPFGSDNGPSLAVRVIYEEPALLSSEQVSPALKALVADCLRKRPEDRPTVERLLERLREISTRAPSLLQVAPEATPLPELLPPSEAPLPPPSTPGPRRAWSRVGVAAAAIAVAMVAGGAVALTWYAAGPSNADAPAGSIAPAASAAAIPPAEPSPTATDDPSPPAIANTAEVPPDLAEATPSRPPPPLELGATPALPPAKTPIAPGAPPTSAPLPSASSSSFDPNPY